MKTYDQKIQQARVKVERAVALLKSAHKNAYQAGKAFEKENPGMDHAYYVWANDVTNYNNVLLARSYQAVNDVENEDISTWEGV